MDDGPSFISPNGSFENVNIAQESKFVAHSSLNEIEVADPGASSKRSSVNDQLKQQNELIEKLKADAEL